MKLMLYPDPVLDGISEPIREIDETVRQMAREMAELMYRYGGIGLAAPQVGISQRLILVSPTGKPETESAYLNPLIHKRKGRVLGEEGCLSLPGIRGHVYRAAWIEFEAQLLSGEMVIRQAQDLEARIIQHEIDHLEGILFISKVQPAEKIALKSKLKAMGKKDITSWP